MLVPCQVRLEVVAFVPIHVPIAEEQRILAVVGRDWVLLVPAVGIGEHDNDTTAFRGRQDAGAVAATGEGGELVWSQTLTPEERRVLKKYFK